MADIIVNTSISGKAMPINSRAMLQKSMLSISGKDDQVVSCHALPNSVHTSGIKVVK